MKLKNLLRDPISDAGIRSMEGKSGNSESLGLAKKIIEAFEKAPS